MADAAPFVHLDVRSCFSLKEGAFTPEQLVHRAAELGMPAVALTDRDGLYGAARFVNACNQHGVQPILGASLTVREAADGGRVSSTASSRPPAVSWEAGRCRWGRPIAPGRSPRSVALARGSPRAR